MFWYASRPHLDYSVVDRFGVRALARCCSNRLHAYCLPRDATI